MALRSDRNWDAPGILSAASLPPRVLGALGFLLAIAALPAAKVSAQGAGGQSGSGVAAGYGGGYGRVSLVNNVPVHRLGAPIPSIENLLTNDLLESKIPGVAIAIAVKRSGGPGQVVYASSAGMEDPEGKKRLNIFRRFPVEMCSGLLVRLATMRLVDAGKLSLETPLSELFEIPANAQLSDSRVRQLRIKHLVDGTAALPALFDSRLAQWTSSALPAQDDIKKLLSEISLSSAPGEDAAENLNAIEKKSPVESVLLACAVAKASGMNIWDYITKEVFNPLEISSPTFCSREAALDSEIFVWDSDRGAYTRTARRVDSSGATSGPERSLTGLLLSAPELCHIAASIDNPGFLKPESSRRILRRGIRDVPPLFTRPAGAFPDLPDGRPIGIPPKSLIDAERAEQQRIFIVETGSPIPRSDSFGGQRVIIRRGMSSLAEPRDVTVVLMTRIEHPDISRIWKDVVAEALSLSASGQLPGRDLWPEFSSMRKSGL